MRASYRVLQSQVMKAPPSPAAAQNHMCLFLLFWKVLKSPFVPLGQQVSISQPELPRYIFFGRRPSVLLIIFSFLPISWASMKYGEDGNMRRVLRNPLQTRACVLCIVKVIKHRCEELLRPDLCVLKTVCLIPI